MEITLSRDDKYNITDIFAYLSQYEDAIIRNDDKSMLPFCADIALKRLFLYDTFPKAFSNINIKRNDILQEIDKYVLEEKCTEGTKKLSMKLKKNVK